MHGHGKHEDKRVNIKTFEYEPHEGEPVSRKAYDISPELEEELLDNGYFLKMRVRRQIKKMQKQNSGRLYTDRFAGRHVRSFKPRRHWPLHSF